MITEVPQYLRDLPLSTPFLPAKETITEFVYHLSRDKDVEGISLATISTGLDYQILSAEILTHLDHNPARTTRLAALMEAAAETADQLERFFIASTVSVFDLSTLDKNPWDHQLVQRYRDNKRIAEVVLIHFPTEETTHYDFSRPLLPNSCDLCPKQT